MERAENIRRVNKREAFPGSASACSSATVRWIRTRITPDAMARQGESQGLYSGDGTEAVLHSMPFKQKGESMKIQCLPNKCTSCCASS